MPVDRQVLLRYRVLNECFRNPYREYTIEDLVDECNKALRKLDKPEVSKRTIQNDIVNMELESLILSIGDDMEVIAPASFRERIAGKIQAMNQRYNQK